MIKSFYFIILIAFIILYSQVVVVIAVITTFDRFTSNKSKLLNAKAENLIF